jgi:hypothetical protein
VGRLDGLLSLGNAVADLARLWLWYAARAVVTCGAAMWGGCDCQSALRDLPRPRCPERQLRSELARGMAEIEAYLVAEAPTRGHRTPRRPTGEGEAAP